MPKGLGTNLSRNLSSRVRSRGRERERREGVLRARWMETLAVLHRALDCLWAAKIKEGKWSMMGFPLDTGTCALTALLPHSHVEPCRQLQRVAG